jgi:hypothetical protein
MKSLNFYLMIGFVAIVFLLCPNLTNAQKARVKAKAKTDSKTKTVTALPNVNRAVGGEPTEEEMKQAVIRAMQRRGATKRDDNTVSVDNPLAGSAVKIVDFEKLGCERAFYGVGYFCTYDITSSLTMYSNEGTADGDRHAQAVNTLIKIFSGGRDSFSETATRRFIRSKQGWIMSKD